MFVEQLFTYSCKIGSLFMVRWIMYLCPNLNLSVNNEEAFKWACSGGHVEIAKHLYNASIEKQKPIDVSVDFDYAFRNACSNGHLSVIEWLAKIKPSILIVAPVCHSAYEKACENGHAPVVWWFHCQNMTVYQFVLNQTIYSKQDAAKPPTIRPLICVERQQSGKDTTYSRHGCVEHAYHYNAPNAAFSKETIDAIRSSWGLENLANEFERNIIRGWLNVFKYVVYGVFVVTVAEVTAMWYTFNVLVRVLLLLSVFMHTALLWLVITW